MNSEKEQKTFRKIELLRSEFSLNTEDSPIKWWEFLIMTVFCYIKEIFECFICTISSHKTIGEFFKLSQPFGDEIFWVLTLKIFLVVITFLYLLYKYRNQEIIWYVTVFLTFIFSSAATSVFSKTNSAVGGLFSLFHFLFFIFLGISLFNHRLITNSLKILLYDNLGFNDSTGKFYKTPWSSLSRERIKKALVISITTIVSAIVLHRIVAWIIFLFNGEPKPSQEKNGAGGGGEETENQKRIIEAAKSNIFYVIFSSIIVAPLVEELLFRQCLMHAGKYRWFTVIISGFLFALIHLHNESIVTIIPYIIPGTMFALSMYLTKNVWISITSHATWNIMSTIMMLVHGKI